MDPSEPLLTTEDVANFLRVDVVTVRRLVSRNEIGAYRIGSEFRFSMGDVRAFLERQHIPAQPPLDVYTRERIITGREQGFLKAFMSQLRVPQLRGAKAVPAATATSRGGLLESFTQQAKQALGNAQEEARRFNHPYVGTEHLLLALIRDEEGITGNILRARGIELERARKAVEMIVGQGEAGAEHGDLELTASAKKVIEYAVNESIKLKYDYVGAEHLLLGLIRKDEGVAAGVLERMGSDLRSLRGDVVAALRGGPAAPAQPDAPTAMQAERGFLELLTVKRRRTPGLMSKLTKRAISALDASVLEAQRLDKTYIGTEHILLGLLTVKDSAAAKALGRVGVSYDAAHEAAAGITTSEAVETQVPPDETPMTASTQRMIELAFKQAKTLGHDYVGTEHLLLGLLKQEDCVGYGVLLFLKVDIERLRAELGQAPGEVMSDE